MLKFLAPLLIAAAPAFAAPQPSDMEWMIDWIQKHSPHTSLFDETPIYKTEGIPMPEIFIVDEREMSKLSGAPMGEVLAMYESYGSMMVLLEGTDFDSIEGKSIVLHELVHHVQNFSGETAKNEECPINLEPDAYRIQIKYLEANADKVDPDFILRMKFNKLYSEGMRCHTDGRPF